MNEQRPSFFTDGAAYERMMGRWSRAAGAIFLDWLALPPGLSWLDVGCGTGAFSDLLLERARPAKIIGIDPSEAQIAHARTRPASAQVDFRVGDAQALPFDDGEFDAAAMALVISFLPDPAKGVREMRRVVRPGGTVATYMWDFRGGGFTAWPLRQAIESIGIALPPLINPEASTLERLTSFFTVAGLTEIGQRTIEIDLTFDDVDDFLESHTALVDNPVARIVRNLPTADTQ